MKLQRLPHDPFALVEFFHEGFEHLGAVCERTWHDRLQLVAEGGTAKLWNADGALFQTELHFPPPQETAPRDASNEVFPGCPLTFHLAEMLLPATLILERVCLLPPDVAKAPQTDSAERLWHAQRPGATRWKQETPFLAAWHFSLLTLARCEIQAIDQHWSLHRVAVSLTSGERDDSLAASLDFARPESPTPASVLWPTPDLSAWQRLLAPALESELAGDLEVIRKRQENYLRREFDRIDVYFAGYENELKSRRDRSASDRARLKLKERLNAARDEHERRRRDQIHRHEIRVIPHLDALLLVAEPAWRARLHFIQRGEALSLEAHFLARSRRWMVSAPTPPPS